MKPKSLEDFSKLRAAYEEAEDDKKITEFIRESNAIEGVWDEEEITQSLRAWEYLKELGLKLNLENILSVHKIIMDQQWPNIAGKLRNCNVMVGGRICPNFNNVPQLLNKFIFEQKKIKTPFQALKAHIEFEHLHPFRDGNGRTGRLIYAHHCKKLGKQWLIFREKDKQGYYSLFD